MTELVLPDDLHQRILDALWPGAWGVNHPSFLSAPELRRDGSIVVQSRGRGEVLTLRSERQSRMAPAAIRNHLWLCLEVDYAQAPNAIRAARVAITRLIRTWDLNGGETILQADKKSGPDRFYSPHPALKEVLREYFARHPVSHHYFGSTMAGYLEGNE